MSKMIKFVVYENDREQTIIEVCRDEVEIDRIVREQNERESFWLVCDNLEEVQQFLNTSTL